MPVYKIKRHNKDGTVTVRYQADAGPDPVTGKRRRTKKKLKSEALQWITEQAGAGKVTAADTISLQEIGDKHVQNRKDAGRERATWQKYEEHFDAHLTAIELSDGDFKGMTLRDVPIGHLRPRHFMQLKTELTKTRSHTMALRIWSTLNAALDYAVAMEWVEFNAAASIKIDRQPRVSAEERVEIPTKVDIAELHGALQPRFGQPLTFGQVFVLVMMSSGLRPSEMRGLRWPNLSIDAAPFGLHVVERADAWNQVGAPKSAAGVRYVPLPASTARLLKEWRLACPKSAERELVFPTVEGHYQHPGNLQNRVWVPLQIAIGLKDPVIDPKTKRQARDEEDKPRWAHRYTLYSLRHAYASIQIELGIQPKALQQRMGHASIQLTMDTYGHLWRDHDRDAADMSAIEGWFAGLPKGA